MPAAFIGCDRRPADTRQSKSAATPNCGEFIGNWRDERCRHFAAPPDCNCGGVALKDAAARLSAKRVGLPEDIADAALFLMKNTYVTGIALTSTAVAC